MFVTLVCQKLEISDVGNANRLHHFQYSRLNHLLNEEKLTSRESPLEVDQG